MHIYVHGTRKSEANLVPKRDRSESVRALEMKCAWTDAPLICMMKACKRAMLRVVAWHSLRSQKGQ